MATFVTHREYLDSEECYCGKRPFKYHDEGKNKFIAKCPILHDPKKKSCDFNIVYHGARPVFHRDPLQEINGILKKHTNAKKYTDPNKELEEILTNLFTFLFVSNRTSTLDEINILVRTRLLRPERKIFYLVTTDRFLREDHRESFADYRKRIFSERIVDRRFIQAPPKPQPPAPKINERSIMNDPIIQSALNRINKLQSKENIKPVRKKKVPVIVDPEFEPELELDNDENESERDSDSDSENADDDGDEDEIGLVEKKCAPVESESDLESASDMEETYDEEFVDDYEDEGGADDDFEL